MSGNRGSALATMLILLSGIGALALAAAAAAMSALALAGHQQDARLALEAAEAGIEYALREAAETRGEASHADVTWPGSGDPQAIYSTDLTAAASPGPEPEGFSLGEAADTFSARHFVIVADASAGRGAAVTLEQSFYLVVPAP